MNDHYDVVVIGGGPAGYPAATQAARMGARTLLVEKNGMLGGTTTVGGVALPGLFHAWGRQIIAGIGWEAVRRSVELVGWDLPDFRRWDRPHYKLQVPISPPVYASVIDETVLTAGVELRLHTMLAALQPLAEGWQVQLCAKEGLQTITTAALVDASGDADAVGLAGLPRALREQRQPGTIMVRFGGYDRDRLDYAALDAAHARAVAEGRLHASDMAQTEAPMRRFLRGGGENSIHVPGVGAATSAEKTAAEVAGRHTLMRIVSFLRTQPGLEALTIDRWANETGIRESQTIEAAERITLADYTSGRSWPDAVSFSFYPIDVHAHDGDGIDIRPLEPGVFPMIPRSAMIPRGSHRMIVAGRAVAGDQEANSAYRVQASCMGMGQAAGAIAALTADAGVDPGEIPIGQVHAAVRAEGAIVPGDPGAPRTTQPPAPEPLPASAAV